MKKIIALPALLALLCVFCACGRASGTKVAARVGPIEFTEDCCRYISMKNMEQYFGEGTVEKDLGDEQRRTLENAVLEEMKGFAAVEILAKEEGIELSSAEETELRAQIARQKVNYGGEEGFEKELELWFMNEHVLYTQLRNQALEEKLYEKLSERIGASLDEAQLDRDIARYCYAASQIYLVSENDAEILGRVRASITDRDSFYEQQSKYSVDNVRGVRLCIEGEMVKEFEEAALELEPGQISPVVRSSIGAHIILREELTGELIEENKESLRQKDVIRIYRQILAEKAAELNVDEKPEDWLILS